MPGTGSSPAQPEQGQGEDFLPPGEVSILHRSLNLDPGRACLLYVGEIKALGLNPFLAPALERFHRKPVDVVAVVPDVLTRYPPGNILVINGEAARLSSETGRLHSVRVPGAEFAAQVSGNPEVIRLVKRLLDRQGSLWVNMFESRPEFTLADGIRVRLVGPDPEVAHRLNNKLIQYELARSLGIPVAPGRCCDSLAAALEAAREFLADGGRVFVTGEYSAAGSNSLVTGDRRRIEERFSGSPGGFLVARFLEHRHDPTVLGVVGGPGEVYVASVADQAMEGTRFRGSSFPTVHDEATVGKLKEMTRIVGHGMGELGYRGTFGCDYILDEQGRVFFVEVNARKQGTTMETTLTMRHNLPGSLSFPEIEFAAVSDERLPGGLGEMDNRKEGLCWATYNVKAEEDVEVVAELPASTGEVDLFERAGTAAGRGWADFIVEDHVGAGVRQRAGGFVARVIAAGGTRRAVRQALATGKERVARTYRPVSSAQDR